MIQCTDTAADRCIVPKAVYTVKKMLLRMANLSPETCRADFKRLIKILMKKKLLLLVGCLRHCTTNARSHIHQVPSQPWHRSAAVSVHCTKSCIYS